MIKINQTLRTVGLTAAAGLLALSSQANAATIVTETFNGGPGIFTAAGSVSYGTYGARMLGTSTAVDGRLAATINTQGVTGMTLGFTSSTTGLDTGEFGEVRVLNQSGTVLYSRQVRTGSLLASGGKISISGTHTSLTVEFRVNANSSTEYLTIDNVLLEGTRSGSCDNLQPGSYNCTLSGRNYEVYVPTLANSNARPIMIDLHDYQQTATTQKNSSGWKQLADTKGLIVAWPQGVNNSWNAQGTCCGTSTADDVAFLKALATKLRTSAPQVWQPVYATGLGNGGSMAHTLACQASDTFFSVIPVGYSLAGGSDYNAVVQTCGTPSLMVDVVQFHGTNDAFSGYYDGAYDSLSAQDSKSAWNQINQCGLEYAASISATTSCQTSLCGRTIDSVNNTLCTVSDGDHNLYNGDVGGEGLAAEAWKLVRKY